MLVLIGEIRAARPITDVSAISQHLYAQAELCRVLPSYALCNKLGIAILVFVLTRQA